LVKKMKMEGRYRVMPLEGGWSSGLGLTLTEEALARSIVASQAIRCFDTTVGVCITEVIAVVEELTEQFREQAQMAVDKEMEAVRETVETKVREMGGSDGGGGGGGGGGSGGDVSTMPTHTIYVRDTKALEGDRQTISITYPFSIQHMAGFFKGPGGACDQAGFNPISAAECDEVLAQAVQYAKEHNAKELGVTRFLGRLRFDFFLCNVFSVFI